MQQSINDSSLFVDTVNQEFDNVDMELAALCSKYYYDPYGWVMHFFDWGYGELAGFDGPDEWQKELLQEVGRQSYDNAFDGVTPVAPQRHVRASGHGIGKSACTSWITMWIMSTRPFSKGTVTANTGTQLSTKTWAELGKWRKLCLTGHWFEYSGGAQSMKMYHKAHPSKWLVTAQTCREENSESFAGQHAPTGCSFYIFDEASAVPDKIYEVAEGGLTDGEPMIFLFGNPTRNTGVFAETFFKKRWHSKQIDSRSCKMTNKRTINEWIEDHGEDSDFIRVRVKGQFPKAGAMQFFPSDLVDDAMTQPIPPTLPDDPLIMAFDVARGGGDDCRIGFRRGLDARSENSYRISYEDSRDSTKVISKVMMVVERHKPDIILVDETGVGGPVLDRLRQLGFNAHGVHFGGSADNKLRYENKTAEMADRLRQWLLSGGSIPHDEELKRQLVGREFWHNHKDQLVLERKDDMKKRLGCSPDWADQMYMLFAHAQFILINKKRDNLVAPHARKAMAHRESDPFKYM